VAKTHCIFFYPSDKEFRALVEHLMSYNC